MSRDLRRHVASLAVVASTSLLASCLSGTQIRAKADFIEENALRTHDAAMRCDMEREIALAESHLEFLRYEMRRGKYLPVREHLDVALRNIEAVIAVVDSRPECFGVVIVTDTDGDGIPDASDNCPWNANVDQADLDRDGLGDVCDDDIDGDGILNVSDNCPTVANPNQEDRDGDGVGDACSSDRDGDGIADSADQCPNDPEDFDGFEDSDGCPERDNDRDGIVDADDDCPLDPEDIDGFEDLDGCPDFDNDADGIPDTRDACPLDPEDFDNDRDDDGCPDENNLVRMVGDMIEISEQINFELNSSNITGDVSYEILDAVAEILIANPDIEIRIEGHTDSQGSSSYNLRLSQGRADAVRAYLTSQGIRGSRLSSVGLGEETPIADNETEDGRALNRRVEFHITAR
jgi:OOP family OmpA-OmpF porin